MASLCSSFQTLSSSHTTTSSSLLTKTAAFAHTTTMQCPKPRRSFPRPISAVFTTGNPKTETHSGGARLTVAPATASHYEVLGLKTTASCQEIKKAYRRLAREFHPDVTGVRNDTDFIRIHEAYSTLSDSERRADYDRAMFIKRSLINEWSSSPFTAANAGIRGKPTTAAFGFPRRTRRTWETDQCW